MKLNSKVLSGTCVKARYLMCKMRAYLVVVPMTLALTLHADERADATNDSSVMMVFFSIVSDITDEDPEFATKFLTSNLMVSETEADQVTKLAREMINESREMRNEITSGICGSPHRMNMTEIGDFLERKKTSMKETIDNGMTELDTRVGNTYVSHQIQAWVSQELKGSTKQVDTHAVLVNRGVDSNELYARLCGSAPQPLEIYESRSNPR